MTRLVTAVLLFCGCVVCCLNTAVGIDPCESCPCKVVKFWREDDGGPKTRGLRGVDPMNSKLTIPVEQALVPVDGENPVYALKCGNAPRKETGNKYNVYQYAYPGTATCEIPATPGKGWRVEVTLPENQWSDFSFYLNDQKQYTCSAAPKE
ncbi:MAG: hypothetical protein K2X87_07425 [Gemmataceae bacterium]|nr:hypothetical protein [Gemmataceae bacterium]